MQSYDTNGNRTNTGYVTGLNNELLSDGTFNYTYDAEGNCTLRQRISGTCDDYQTIYQWDNRNRLVSVTFKNNSLDVTKTVNYVYDANNLWLGETIANGSGTVVENRRFAYDGQQIVLQFDSTSSSNLTAANLSHRYLWGPAVDQLMADEQVSGSQTLWALTDHQNTVRDLATFTSGTTSIVNHRVFSAYGELLSQTNPTTHAVATLDSLIGYTGRAMSRFSTNPTTGAVTGIQNNNARWYDAIVGRWLGVDPKGYSAGDMNLYRYCANNPTTHTDPTGTECVKVPANTSTLVCQKGQLRIQLSYSAAHEIPAIKKCILAHETEHWHDWTKRYGQDLCKGVADGYLPVGGDNYKEFLRQSECNAHKVELKCLNDALCDAKGNDKRHIMVEIAQVNRQLEYYKCK